MIKRLCLVALLSGMTFFIAAQTRGEDTSPTQAATQPAAGPVVDAHETKTLIGLSGQPAIVDGTVEKVVNASTRVSLVDFKGNERHDFTGVSFAKHADAHAWIVGDGGKALVGKHVQLHGIIYLYRGAPQIEIVDPGQLKVIDQPATQP